MRVPTVLSRKKWLAAVGLLLVAVVAAGCGQSARAQAPTEVTHASYIDLTGNITDLRSRVTQWQNGDEASLGIAEEKLERIEVVLGAISWPESMEASIARTEAAVAPMAKALEASDSAAAEAAAKEFGDASHDVIHDLYGYFLPEREGSALGQMAAHVIYLDLTANISDLRTRITQWESGDEASMNIAKEKAERIAVLLPHLASAGALVKWVGPIGLALPDVFMAIEMQDVAAAQRAVKPIADASRGLSRDAYAWMDLVSGMGDPACVQASYLDLSRNISALRANVAAWQKGDTGALELARDNLSRAQILLAHPAWPGEMATAVARSTAAIAQTAHALGQSDPVAAETAAPELGEGSHDLTHDFYGVWLPSGSLAVAGAPAGSATARVASKGHGGDGHGTATAGDEVVDEGPNWAVIGGFAGLLGLVIGGGAVTRPKGAAKSKAGGSTRPAPRPAES